MAQGEFVQVRQHLEAALRITSDLGENDDFLYSMLVDAAAQQEDLAALKLYGPIAEASAEQYDHLFFQAIANRSSGTAYRLRGEPIEAKGKLDQALFQFQELGTRWQQGRTLSELGKLAASQDDNDLAQRHYKRALILFEEMRALPDIERGWLSRHRAWPIKLSGNGQNSAIYAASGQPGDPSSRPAINHKTPPGITPVPYQPRYSNYTPCRKRLGRENPQLDD